MIWGQEGDAQWLDPFMARLLLGENRSLQTWTLAFGSSAAGLRQNGYTQREKIRQKINPAFVTDWIFAFREGGIRVPLDEELDS